MIKKLFRLLFLGLLILPLSQTLSMPGEPSVSNINIVGTPLLGTFYDSGETLLFQVSFNAAADVTGLGNPQLKVKISGNDQLANYNNGSGTDTWTFALNVGPGMNDANGISATEFSLLNGGIKDSISGNALINNDFPDFDFPSTHIDADIPAISAYEVDSTDGNIVGVTRYLNADDDIIGKVTLTNDDTRGATSIELTIGGIPHTLSFVGSATAGTVNTFQKTSTTNFLDGFNGSLAPISLNYTDVAGKSPVGTPSATLPSSAIVVDTIFPVINFTDDVGTTETSSEGINIAVTDANNLNPNIHEYGFSTDAVCDANDSYPNTFTSGIIFNITDPNQDQKYICVRAKDLAENTSYLASSNPLNLDATAPTIISVAQSSSNTNAGWAKENEAITYDITFSEAVTVSVNTSSTATNAAILSTEVDASNTTTDKLIFTVQAGDNGVVTPSVDFDITDMAGNQTTITSLGPITGGSLSNTITADTIVPTLNMVKILSDNTNTAWAKTGDKITLNIAGSEVLATSKTTATIATETATTTKDCPDQDCQNYHLDLITDGNEPEALVVFNIKFEDPAGNKGVDVTAVTDASSVTFDKTAPTVPSVSIASNNSLNTKLAKTNDTITITATINDNLSTIVSLLNSSILSKAATSNTMTATGAGKTLARFTDGSETSETVVPFSFKVADLAGNASLLIDAVTDGSSVKFDRTDPVTQNIKISATSADSSAYSGDVPTYYAKQGDTLKLVMDICDYVDSDSNPPTGTLFGQSVTMTDEGLIGGSCTTGTGNPSQWRNWKAELTSINGLEGEITFDITAKDNAGNQVVNITGTTDSSRVIFDKTKPTNPTDVVDLGGVANSSFKPSSEAKYSWTNDKDPAGGNPVSDVHQFKVRYVNSATSINESVTIDAPTRNFNPANVIPDTAAYDLFMSIIDKAGNASTEAKVYTQKYGVVIKGKVTEKDSGNAVENALVVVISEFGNECQPGQDVCVATTDSNGEYSVIVASNKNYIVDFLKIPNHYLAKESVTLTTNNAIVNPQLSLVEYPETQGSQQTIVIKTDKISSETNEPTQIFISSLSGEIKAEEKDGKIIITSFGKIIGTKTNDPDVQITHIGNNIYEITGSGDLKSVSDLNTQSNNVSTSFESGAIKSGTETIIGGTSITGFNGVRREDRFSGVIGMTYRESLAHAQKMNEGASARVNQYVNRNGYVVFGGYQSGTIGLEDLKRFDQTKHIVFRGQKTGYGRQREFINNQEGALQLIAVRGLFKSSNNKEKGTVIIKDGNNTIIAKAAEERVTTIKGRSRKSMPGYGKKTNDIQTIMTRKEFEKHDFNPYGRTPRKVSENKSRIRPKNTGQIYIKHGSRKTALKKVFEGPQSSSELVAKEQ